MKFLIQINFIFVILSLVSSDVKIDNPSQQNKNDCPKNMVLLPESEDSMEMNCDCKSKFLYHRDSDSCHEAYKRGPCPSGHHFVLPTDEISAKCVKNPCNEDGLVYYHGSCHTLGQNGPPCQDSSVLLDINEISFEVECKPTLLFDSRLNVHKNTNDCPRGSRRIYSGKCKHVFQ